jgi:hypothetical protein
MMIENNHTNTILTKIKQYIDLCENKSIFHRNQAKNSLNWFNILGIINVILTASQALSMTVMSVIKIKDTDIAIVGGVFACVLAVTSRIQSSFSFNSLSVQHNQISDDFGELVELFMFVIDDIETDNYNEKVYQNLVHRYISIQEKTHIQTVRECHLLSLDCCCKS